MALPLSLEYQNYYSSIYDLFLSDPEWILRVIFNNLKVYKTNKVADIWCLPSPFSKTRTFFHEHREGISPSLQLKGGGCNREGQMNYFTWMQWGYHECEGFNHQPSQRWSLRRKHEGQYNGLLSSDPHKCKGLITFVNHYSLNNIKAPF